MIADTMARLAAEVSTRGGPIAQVCPKAPPGAQVHVDDLTGYVLWGVRAIFTLAVVTGVGAMVAGRLFSMPHASKAGLISLVVVFLSAIAYAVVPGILKAVTGAGCIS